MALQTSGAISIGNLRTEFGDTGSSSLSEFYRGGSLVPNTATNSAVPTSGAISLFNFYGAAATAQSWQWVQTYTSINEGVTRTFKFEDVNDIITSGAFTWSINGNTTDFNAVSGTGTISGTSQGSFSISTLADSLTEGTENYTLSVSYGGSTVLTQVFSILDTSLTPTTINVVRSQTNVNEGTSFTFYATSTETITGTVNFSLGGTATSGSDYTTSGATGSFTFSNSTTSNAVTISTIADITTEGAENVSCTISSPSATGFDPNIGTGTLIVTINDTSIASYSLSSSTASVDEGGSFTVTFVTNQTGSFPYTITGVISADINEAGLTGNVSNGDVLTFNVTADSTTEGSETFDISLNNTLASTSVTINDTSKTPSYSLSSSTASVDEGDSFTVTFVTNQAGSFPYTITGVISADINGAGLTGNVSNGDVLTFNVTADSTTEGSETFDISLNNTLASTSVTINDTSKTPSYAFSSAFYNVTEGSSSTITVSTANVPNGTTLYWSLASDPGNDISTDSGPFTINSNSGSFSVSAIFDSNYSESTETLTLQLRTGSTSGTVQDTANLNIINTGAPSVSSGTTTYRTYVSSNQSGAQLLVNARTTISVSNSSSGITISLDGSETGDGTFTSLTTNNGNPVTAYTVSAPGSNLTQWKLQVTGSSGPTSGGTSPFTSTSLGTGINDNTYYSVGAFKSTYMQVQSAVEAEAYPSSSEIDWTLNIALYFKDSFNNEYGPYSFTVQATATAYN